MHIATVLALIGFLYSGLIGFGSMGVSLFFRNQDLLVVGHVIILLVFVGAGMGYIAWVKQRFGDPLVNVAGALASLGCVTVLVKEGSVQEGAFSVRRMAQILIMVFMGIVVATAVNVLVLPRTARTELRKAMEESTDSLGELLISITRAFLSGREDDLQDDYFDNLQKEQLQSLQKMSKDLDEAKNEYLVLGGEKLYDVSTRLVECLDTLSQDLGGLRSAALAQFAQVNSYGGNHPENTPASSEERKPSWYKTVRGGGNRAQNPNILDVIAEAPDESPNANNKKPLPGDAGSTAVSTPERRESVESLASTLKTPDDLFFTFIKQLGPPTKSLVYTLKQILDELPFKEPSTPHLYFSPTFDSNVEIAINENFHSSLKDAVELYRSSRKEALRTLYASRSLSAAFMPQGSRKGTGAFSGQRTASVVSSPAETRQQQTPILERPPEEVLADIEEVSACCEHFSFSLLDFAEDVLTYLHVLDDLKEALEQPKSSWKWLMFWRISWISDRRRAFKPGTDFEHGEGNGATHEIPEPIRKADEFADPEKPPSHQLWTWRLYRKLRIFRRDDVKFAVKVGIGAILYSLPAFIESTRPWFTYWRGEWGLVSYMAVCAMTTGAANTTGIKRFIGTGIGACLAIIAWILASDHGDANPYLLAFFGWLVAIGCFYLILAKSQGPMGRFILLTYNLGALYAYSLSVHDDDQDDDEGGIDPAIWGTYRAYISSAMSEAILLILVLYRVDIVLHRLAAVCVGTLWAIIVTRFIWPISARSKLKDGLCILWLRMSLVWKRDPLAMFLLGE